MTKANTLVIAKMAAAIAAIGLVVSAFALTANAQSASACASFNRDLTVGATGADVTALQNWLIGKGFTIAAGATGYFGGQTQAALARYQASVSISPAAGYFGPITRAKVGAECAGGGSDDDDDDDSGSDDDDGDLEGGEADLSDFEINDEESEGAEGEEMVDIASIEFDVEDGDVMVERVEFMASSTNSSLEDRPWDFFDTLYLLDSEGDEVASIDAGDRDEWDEEDGDGADIHRVVFSGVDTIVREDDRAMFTLSADIASNIDTADLSQDFDFYVPDDGVRARDGEDIDHYIPSADSDEVTFGFEEEETGDLDINSSSDDPDNMTLVSDEDDDVEIDDAVFVFEIENNDNVDVLITDITIDVATSSGDSIDSLLTEATLVVDGEEVDGDINDDGTIDFEDIDVVIGGDDEIVVELFVEVAEDADGTVDFSVDSADVTAESDDDGDDADVSGSASSETHTIALTGVSVEGVSTDSDANDDNTLGTYTITFEVTAEGDEDIYIYQGAGQSDNDSSPFTLAASTTGVAYTIFQGGSASTTDFASDSAILTSGADTSGNYFVVEDGETEQFTLTVTLDPATTTATALYYVELDAIRFDDETAAGTANDTVYLVPDDAEFQTNAETLAA